MAASEDPKISTENYFKALLALDCTRTGLKDFVKDGINALHQTFMQKLSHRNPCTSCTIPNVLSCPTRGFCKGRPCQMHSNCPCKQCPNNFCNSFMSEIRNVHRRREPTWQNTDIKCWWTDPWQIAKCFCPLKFDKYTSADDTDLPGLIHIITNCTEFQANIAENLAAPGNVFHQVRESRNQINHSSTTEMHKTILSDHIEKMIEVLEDSTFLINHAPAVEAVKKLRKLVDEPLLMTREEKRQMKKEAKQYYEKDKTRLQSHLADQYLTQFSKISLSPLVSEITANFDDISVPQSMKQVKLSHETEHEGKQQNLPKDVKYFDDIFTRNSQKCKNIYIKGEPGAGKSFLSQRIALSWSKFMTGKITEDEDDFIKPLKQFSFLFYISLRYARGENSLEKMILKHPFLECEEFGDLIKRILREEFSVCLIVVDGLDEWASTQTTLGISKGLPLRNMTKRCTTMTTTRPWKLEVIRMAPKEMDQLIEIKGMDEDSSMKYIDSLIERLNKKCGGNKSVIGFIEMLKSHDLRAFMTLPVLLKYLVCLWHADRPIGNSQCEIYSGLLDLLLQLPEKESECRNEALESLKQAAPAVNLPLCFNGKQNCLWFGSLLQRLSKLAFHTLFAENQESSLVFDSKRAEIQDIDIKACLNIGILSQDIVMEQCAIPEMSLSFLHKTFQEFLAAVYVYMSPDQTDSIYLTVSKYCSSVGRLMEVSKVIVFMSGICPAMVSRVSEHVAGIVSEAERVQAFRQGFDCVEYFGFPRICVSVQDLMVECIKEAKRAGLSHDLNTYIQEIAPHKDTARLSSIIQQSRGTMKFLDLDLIPCTDLQQDTLSQLFEGLSHLEAIRLFGARLSHERYVGLMSYLSRRTGLRQIHLTKLICTEDQSEPRSHDTGTSQCTELESESESIESEFGRVRLDLTSHAQLTALTLSELHTDHIIQMPTSCPQLTTLTLSELHTDNIQMPTSCPQLCTLTLSKIHTDHIQIPTSCPQLTTLQLSGLHAYRIQMPTSYPKLITLQLSEICVDHIRMPTSCPKLTTLKLAWLHTDHIQLPTDMSHIQSCRLWYIHTRGAMVSALQALRHSSHLHTLDVEPSDDEILEVTDAVIDVLPTLHHIRDITLWRLHFVGRQLRLSPLMTDLEQVKLWVVTLARESLHNLIDSIVEIPHTQKVELYNIITPDTDTDSALDNISRALPGTKLTKRFVSGTPVWVLWSRDSSTKIKNVR